MDKQVITVMFLLALAACGGNAPTYAPDLEDTTDPPQPDAGPGKEKASPAPSGAPGMPARVHESGQVDLALATGDGGPDAVAPAIGDGAAPDTGAVTAPDAAPDTGPAPDAGADAPVTACVASWDGNPVTLPTAAEACTSNSDCCSGVCGDVGGGNADGYFCVTPCAHNAQCGSYYNCNPVWTHVSVAFVCYGNAPGSQN